MIVPRGEIAKRCLLLHCPNCDARGQLRNWFQLHRTCPQCGLAHGGEDGFTFSTTSIGYVVSFLLVVLPVCILVVMNLLSVWLGVVIGIVGAAVVTVGLFPVFLGWVLLMYYVPQADGLPVNKTSKAPTPSVPPATRQRPR